MRKDFAVAGISAGHDAVKLIDAMANTDQEILGRTDTHKVAGFGRWHESRCVATGRVQLLCGLSHGQTANSKPFATLLRAYLFHMLSSEIEIDSAFNNTVERYILRP